MGLKKGANFIFELDNQHLYGKNGLDCGTRVDRYAQLNNSHQNKH